MSSATSSSLERMESPSSPLLLEDCFMSFRGNHSDVAIEPRLCTNIPSLFNESDEQENLFDSKGMTSPTLSTTDSNDGLPISDDSWSLLQEFEALTKPDKAPSVNSCLMNNDLILEELKDDFVLPEFAQLDDLLMINNELSMSTVDPTPLGSSSTGVDAMPCIVTLPSDSKLPEVSTSDLLANLISHTLLMDPSLEGLLSSTTLDLSTVFGTSTKTDAGLETPNKNSTSDHLCSPSQEVPEFQMTDDENSITRKRSAASLSSCESDSEIRIISPEPKPKKKKSGEEKYAEMRQKNNEASRRSRLVRKQKHQSLEEQAIQLTEDNKKLKEKAELLEKTVKTLKAALVRHILDLKAK